MTFPYGRWLRGLALVAVSLLGVALALRALVALVEALAVLGLVIIVASVALPRSIGWYWRQARRELSKWLQDLGTRLRVPDPENPEGDRQESGHPKT